MIQTRPKARTVQRGSSTNRPVSSTQPKIVAVRIRSLSIDARIGLSGNLIGRTAESPLALPVKRQCGVEMRGREIGPRHVGEVELGVREIPQQEVADAHL